jgi:cysteine desulfurase
VAFAAAASPYAVYLLAMPLMDARSAPGPMLATMMIGVALVLVNLVGAWIATEDARRAQDLAQAHALQKRLLDGLKDVEQVFINGSLEHRVPHNLNISFNYVEGESLMMGIKGLAVSSGSACTSASLEPSYVLRALGRSDELAHSSLRMTIGRWSTEEEIDYAVATIKENVAKLRELSPLWEMFKDGVDLSTIQWAAH